MIGSKLRFLVNAPMVEIPCPWYPRRALIAVGIFLREPSAPGYCPAPPEHCPVCGETFANHEGHCAMLNPRFEGGVSYVMNVLVHRECLEACVESTEPEPLAW